MLLWCLRLWALFMSRRFGSFSKCFELFKEVVFSAEIFWMPIGSPCRASRPVKAGGRRKESFAVDGFYQKDLLMFLSKRMKMLKVELFNSSSALFE